MVIKFSDEFKAILAGARDEAMRTGHYGIGADHLMLAILRRRGCEAFRFLSEAGLDTGGLKRRIDEAVFREKPVPYNDEDKIGMKRSAAGAVSVAAYEALKAGAPEVRSTHLLLALSRAEDSVSRAWLTEHSLGSAALRESLEKKGLSGNSPGRPEVRMEDVVSALGEQLTNLVNARRDRTGYVS